MPSQSNDSPTRDTAPDAEQFACQMARLLADGKCQDVLVLDLRGISQVTDYFVIATGTSDRQIAAVGEELRVEAKAAGWSALTRPNTETTQWVVVDFVTVVAHLFSPEARAYYDLESLWADGQRVNWRAVAGAPEPRS